jgi:hypothetical protein
MTLLPEKLGSTEKKPGTHFPTNHVGPLVTKDRQVPVRFDPSLVAVPDDGFTGWTHYQFFFKTCRRIHHHAGTVGIGHQPVMRYNGTLFGKSFYMFGLPAQKRFWYK